MSSTTAAMVSFDASVDLNEFGRARLEDDYARTERRGRRSSRIDFAAGWEALAVRHRLWSYFTAEARARLEQAV